MKCKFQRARLSQFKPLVLLFVILLIPFYNCSAPRDISTPTILSTNTQDRYELYIDTPVDYSTHSNHYSVVFYMDANLKSGNELRRQIALPENKERLKNLIFVGVGHIGNYRKLRRRDFIPPLLEDGSIFSGEDEFFGHADDFYRFMGQELIPYVNNQYPNNGRYTFIGHSFSGLFAFYALMQQDRLFTNHIALSPSLWANYDNFFEIEETYSRQHRSLETFLYHACSSTEWANKVRSTSRKMRDTLKLRNYIGLEYIYNEAEGKGHNDMVSESLNYVLNNVVF